MDNTATIELSRAWLESKAAEEAAKASRIEIEEALGAQLGVKTEGARTHNLGEFKVTLTGVVNRSLDKDVWEKIKDQLPPEIRPVTYEPKLDVAGVKWLRDNHPSIYKLVAQAITVKPGKTRVLVAPVNKS